MSSFKLIAIRPHHNCGHKFLKVLEPGRLYQFYNEYEFYTNDGKFDGVNGEITRYEYKRSVPDDLYKVCNLNVNISAVVGKNGTGKSTLIELLLYCVYFLGTKLKNDNGDKILHPYDAHIHHMIKANREKIDEFVQKRNNLNDFVKNCIVYSNKLTKSQKQKRLSNYNKKVEDLLDLDVNIIQLEKRHSDLEKDLDLVLNEHKSIIAELKCSIIFEIDGAIFSLEIDDDFNFLDVKNKDKKSTNSETTREVKLITILNPKSADVLNSFFYSILLNYSHHSLNAKHLGFWINTLFHKNDGYKTPAVINPMRENGVFNINHENYLAKQRLLTNLLIDCLVNDNQNPFISDKLRLLKVRFTKNEQKEVGKDIRIGNKASNDPKDDFIISGKNVNLLKKIYDLSFDEENLEIYNNALPFNELIHNYISDKSLKIEEQYPEYRIKWNKDDNDFTVTDRYARFLIDDNSHITYKLKQALYFLQKTSVEGKSSVWGKDQEFFEFDLSELLKWMEVKNINDLQEIFKRIPPSVFTIDFLLNENVEEPEKYSFFEELSSGEQQKIHTTNTVIYHLNNLYSVHLAKSEKKRIKYQYLNIILDEIELYYHPDLQRRFINDLIDTIKIQKHLAKAEYIKGLNFIFSTHSPFILSDIPMQNVLLMGNENKSFSKQKTFSANIYDLLANAFFMDEGYIGEYAKSKIRYVIDYVNNGSYNNESQLKYEEIVNLIGDRFIREKLHDMLLSKKKIRAND
ncbi:MAG: hypothetical protein KF704_12345 [Crocinitomicaceae bacterium]|nr:hypothetical protein [Crocinitomicaceae bacterium]